MENRTLKIFMSCALGAGIGALIALQLNHYFWWIGILIGGFIGYISYEFNRVIAAIPLAWRYATKNISIWKPYRYRPNKQTWKDGIFSIVYVLQLLISWVVVCIIIGLFLSDGVLLKLLFSMALVACIWSLAIIMIIPIVIISGEATKDTRQFSMELLIHWNSLSVLCFYFPKMMWCIGKALIVGMPYFLFAVGRFFKYLFLLIHSDIRLLCGVDAAIGACVGYFAGSVIIGVVAGGVFGVINYELITKRVLGIIPTRRE